jgi:carbamoyltransferase
MNILGFNCYAHDAAAAIVGDGDLLGVVEEERFLRKKHVGEFPHNSIRWCCEIAGIAARDLDAAVYYWNPRLGRLQRLKHLLRYFPKSLGLVLSRGGKETAMLALRGTLRRELELTGRTQVHFAEHHVCHAASSFLTSPFDQAAILSIDAAGEWDCTWMGVGEGLDMRPLKKTSFPHSLGLVYGAVTEFLGFKFASGEGKVMGLAPYGDPARYIDEFRKIVRTTDEGGFAVDLSYFTYHYLGRPRWFSSKFYQVFGPPRAADGELSARHNDVAAALQQRTEEVGLHLARWLQKTTGLNKVCLAGGVCLNSVMNGKILLDGVFDEVVVQPAANDAGTAVGACFWLWNTVLRRPRRYVFEHAYLGPSWSDDQVRAAIRETPVDEETFGWRQVPDAPALAARMLAEGKIIGWFQGRMELGPRALGNRSILTDPRPAGMKDLLNARVKFREGFRPFAPSVLEEKTGEWFNSAYPSPYMILVYDVLPEKRGLVPAITHVDGTGRVHSVSKTHNPQFHALVSEFERLTGVPIVLNTSFNIRGEPIVNHPREAIQCFLQTGMDALFLHDFLLTKTVDSAARAMSAEQVRAAQLRAAAADNELV